MFNVESNGKKVWVCLDGASIARFASHYADINGARMDMTGDLTKDYDHFVECVWLNYDYSIDPKHRPEGA